MTLKILNANEKREIEEKIKNQFGVDEIRGILIKSGKERLFFFSGNFSKEMIKSLEESAPVERIGVYFAKIVNEEIRLSIEGVQILKDQINKNILKINDEQAERWMKGQELDIKTGKRGFLIIKNNEDFLGCGKASEEKVGNFIPKTRRLKEKS